MTTYYEIRTHGDITFGSPGYCALILGTAQCDPDDAPVRQDTFQAPASHLVLDAAAFSNLPTDLLGDFELRCNNKRRLPPKPIPLWKRTTLTLTKSALIVNTFGSVPTSRHGTMFLAALESAGLDVPFPFFITYGALAEETSLDECSARLSPVEAGSVNISRLLRRNTAKP